MGSLTPAVVRITPVMAGILCSILTTVPFMTGILCSRQVTGPVMAGILCSILAIVPGSMATPHIILIVADDLGWNDVGFHGSNQIPTPNIDSLAYSGIILQNYYVDPICTPSISALLTGKHPIHTGLQSNVLVGAAPYALPTHIKV